MRDFAQKETAPLVDEAKETNVFPKQLFKKLDDLGFPCPRYLGNWGAVVAKRLWIVSYERSSISEAPSPERRGFTLL